MAENRRSLITPEKLAFLKGEREPQQQSESRRPTSLQVEAKEDAVTVTYRLRPSIIKALRRVSFERKEQKVEPWAQQDIVNEAIEQWLQRNK
jgi:hypothetical protein